jgi:hypothetical protein
VSNALLVTRSEDRNRVIVGQLLVFDANNGKWLLDNQPPPSDLALLVAGTIMVAQRWLDGRVIETLWPDDVPSLARAVEEGNEAIPKEEWEEGQDGKAKPPWALAFVVYLVDPLTAKKYTVAASTVGQKIAYELLTDQIETMRTLRGQDVVAECVLGVGSFPTRFGTRKPRPDYDVCGWRILGPGRDKAPPLALSKVEEPTTGELLNDELPY